ncbi:hypothetical protein Vafri_16925 [Volvox africanus]|uniref:Uncharacterized protein n=1 Tax=Volvox africanus TaxID=51714 RepID=A0A8J4BK24_9CHLO|nr:hypothetical protein Vafri_16925 [Volvox africanus]
MASRGNVESLAKRSTRGPSGAGIGRQRALITPDRACLWPIYIKSEIPFAAPGTLGRSLNGGLAGGGTNFPTEGAGGPSRGSMSRGGMSRSLSLERHLSRGG